MEHAIKDPFHPTLFYHLFPAENPPDSLFALSFLSERPVELRSRTILGWLPAASNEDESRLHEFEENGAYRYLLKLTHSFIRIFQCTHDHLMLLYRYVAQHYDHRRIFEHIT